jgi:P pilus assembly chaperone PapD
VNQRNLILAGLGLAALCALPVTEAGTFNISPLRVDFAGAKATAALTVRNEEAASVVMQAQGIRLVAGWQGRKRSLLRAIC